MNLGIQSSGPPCRNSQRSSNKTLTKKDVKKDQARMIRPGDTCVKKWHPSFDCQRRLTAENDIELGNPKRPSNAKRIRGLGCHCIQGGRIYPPFIVF